MRKLHEEDDHQAAFFEWLNYAYPDIAKKAFAIPNGGKRDAREAARLKKQGVRAGVSDIFIAHPLEPATICGWTDTIGRHHHTVKKSHGLWIEMKRPISKDNSVPTVTKEQSAWIDLMNANNYYAAVCYGWEEAKELVEGYLR